MKNNQMNQNGPKDVAPSKGPNAMAVEASASIARYTKPAAGDKQKAPQATYIASAGRKWAYRGKRARVMTMLVQQGNGVTQWDTLPWHTRLGGTIHALRKDGLSITTEREGDCNHARYRLATPGTLIIQGENSQPSVFQHRGAL